MRADQLAAAASLLADRTRAASCLALLDHRAWTIGELARHAAVAPSTASEHVTKLVDGGMLTAVHQGRSRYVRLAGPQVAELIEGLGWVASAEPVVVRSLRKANPPNPMPTARTCSPHLPGPLTV